MDSRRTHQRDPTIDHPMKTPTTYSTFLSPLLLTPQQRHLWRLTAYTGFIYGCSAVVAVLLIFVVGFNAAYFEQAVETRRVASLFTPESRLDYILAHMALLLIFPTGYVIAGFFWLMVREAVVPAQMVIFRQIILLAVTANIGIALVLGVVAYYSQFYAASDAQRADFIVLVIVITFFYNFTIYIASTATALAAYRAQTLSPLVCGLLIAFDVVLGAVDFLARTPDFPAVSLILGEVIGGMRMVALAAYMWFMAHQ